MYISNEKGFPGRPFSSLIIARVVSSVYNDYFYAKTILKCLDISGEKFTLKNYHLKYVLRVYVSKQLLIKILQRIHLGYKVKIKCLKRRGIYQSINLHAPFELTKDSIGTFFLMLSDRQIVITLLLIK